METIPEEDNDEQENTTRDSKPVRSIKRSTLKRGTKRDTKPAAEPIKKKEPIRYIFDYREKYVRNYVPEDWRDILSLNPSYSKFEVPYFMKCRDRYHNSTKRYERQFQREIHFIMSQLNSAFEAVRLVRHLGITTIWPPLHNRAELNYTQNHFFPLTPKQRQRLRRIMITDIQ